MVGDRKGSKAKMWGWPLDVWDNVAFWTLVAGSLLAAAAVALTGFSSFVSLKTASITQRISDEKIADATARGDAARADAAKAISETARLSAQAEEARLEIAKANARAADGPKDHFNGIAETFDEARAGFEAAWQILPPRRSPADFRDARHREAWTAEKYARMDRGHRTPPLATAGI